MFPVLQVRRRRVLGWESGESFVEVPDQELAEISSAGQETAGRRLQRRIALEIAVDDVPGPSGPNDVEERGWRLRLAEMREGAVCVRILIRMRERVRRSRHA